MIKKIVFFILAAAFIIAYVHQRRAEVKSPTEGALVLYGNVDIRELTLGFRVPGRVEAMLKEEGDQVHPGELLARLDAKPYQDDLEVKEAQIRETEARLVNAQKNLARRESLLRNKSLSQSDYDEALAARDELLARLDTVRAQRALSLTSLGDAELRTPSAGTVLTRVREPGSVVAAGEIVYTVSLSSPVWIRAWLDEPDLGRAWPGQKVRVTTDSGGEYEAKIAFISPKAEFTPRSVETAALRTDLVYRLRIVVEAPDKGLRQGMPVTLFLLEDQSGGA
ncbi:MAG: efflux RND transporter periplasmic adaptor subunit [Deltaproteobacteria bacterium]|jgi:HlyD family secretion protein|nr:efflux RND transporter periplasmic adaptor subunit [Deltaproteobacteria bacterium]